jgi:hypothetical protein
MTYFSPTLPPPLLLSYSITVWSHVKSSIQRFDASGRRAWNCTLSYGYLLKKSQHSSKR